MSVVLSVIVPTYQRTASFLRLCTSVERFAPRLSRLDERYPGRIVRDPHSWWGFREVTR